MVYCGRSETTQDPSGTRGPETYRSGHPDGLFATCGGAEENMAEIAKQKERAEALRSRLDELRGYL